MCTNSDLHSAPFLTAGRGIQGLSAPNETILRHAEQLERVRVFCKCLYITEPPLRKHEETESPQDHRTGRAVGHWWRSVSFVFPGSIPTILSHPHPQWFSNAKCETLQLAIVGHHSQSHRSEYCPTWTNGNCCKPMPCSVATSKSVYLSLTYINRTEVRLTQNDATCASQLCRRRLGYKCIH